MKFLLIQLIQLMIWFKTILKKKKIECCRRKNWIIIFLSQYSLTNAREDVSRLYFFLFSTRRWINFDVIKKRGSNFLSTILGQSRRRVCLTANMGSKDFSKKSCITSLLDLEKEVHHEGLFIDGRASYLNEEIYFSRFTFKLCMQTIKLYIFFN